MTDYFHGHTRNEPHPWMTSTGSEGRCELCGLTADAFIHRSYDARPDRTPDRPGFPSHFDESFSEEEYEAAIEAFLASGGQSTAAKYYDKAIPLDRERTPTKYQPRTDWGAVIAGLGLAAAAFMMAIFLAHDLETVIPEEFHSLLSYNLGVIFGCGLAFGLGTLLVISHQ